MAGTIIDRALGRFVAFTRAGEPDGIESEGVRLRIYVGEQGSRMIVLTVRMTFDAFTRVEDGEWFGMTRASVDPDMGWREFWSTLPIEVDLRLEAPGRLVADAIADPEKALDQVDLALAEGDPAFADEAGWQYLSVVQERRPGVSTGFSSIHARETPQ